jgi:predicted alpha/beta superfamily hydrolase
MFKLFNFILFLFLSFSSNIASAESNSFSIPRSEIVEIGDIKNERIYPLFIKLPRSYNRNTRQNYPVIYLTDAWYSFQIVSGATRFPMNTGKIQEAIIVGISYEKGAKGDTSRVRDYTPHKASAWKKETGGAYSHAAFIKNHVFKYIDENYRTDKVNRTFVGNSLGGLFGSYILLTDPNMFNNYILGSPSFWFNNKSLFKTEALMPANNIDQPINVFVGIGEQEAISFGNQYDMVNDAKVFIKTINHIHGSKVNSKLLVIPEADHYTAFPTTAVQGIDWIYRVK